jgi:hypothetical protein
MMVSFAIMLGVDGKNTHRLAKFTGSKLDANPDPGYAFCETLMSVVMFSIRSP